MDHGESVSKTRSADQLSPVSAGPLEHEPAGSRQARPRALNRPEIRSWYRRILRSLFWTADKLTPAIVAVLGLAFLVVPDLKPREPQPPPSTLGATLSDVRLEERTVWDNRPFVVISFDVEFAAYKGHVGLIEWSVFDAATMQRYDLKNNRENPSVANQDGGAIIAEAPSDRVSGQILVPVPLSARCVFVRVYISEPKGDGTRTRLDYADTAPFDTHAPSNQSCAGIAASPTPPI